ncbi:MAG: ABC transporter ATP-binding protein, partial [Chlamydiia bacterium]|nr:ABC transporter ATP-binding protein [Chlamydiia bacterium]
LALSRPVSCLVLDEPTNHLDLPSSEALEAALVAWPGALVVATHDARFGEAVTSAVVEVRDGRATMAM